MAKSEENWRRKASNMWASCPGARRYHLSEKTALALYVIE
jgi:hypothetical protein